MIYFTRNCDPTPPATPLLYPCTIFQEAAQLSPFQIRLSVEKKILGEMTRMKIWDRENQKILTGFRDMAVFVMGNRDPIHPLVGLFIYLVICNRSFQASSKLIDIGIKPFYCCAYSSRGQYLSKQVYFEVRFLQHISLHK